MTRVVVSVCFVLLIGSSSASAEDDTTCQKERSIAYEHEGVTYRFLSEANRERFKGNPEKNLPAFGG